MAVDNKYKETAEAGIASVKPGDNPTDVESKLLGLTHPSGRPSTDAAEGPISAELIEGE